MPNALDSPQVVGYVDEHIKDAMVKLKEHDRRYTLSRQIEEALEKWLTERGLLLPRLEFTAKRKG